MLDNFHARFIFSSGEERTGESVHLQNCGHSHINVLITTFLYLSTLQIIATQYYLLKLHQEMKIQQIN